MTDDARFWDWFAGFVAADGCFYSVRERTGWVQPRFMIHLRDDDLDILMEVQERLGFGNLYKKPSYRPGDNPAVQLQIAQAGELARLIEIFDKHPIRAKKQRDFRIWSELVQLAQVSPSHRDRERIEFLHQKLRFVKQYHESDDVMSFKEFEREGPTQLSMDIE